MIGRFANPGDYHELFCNRDFLKVAVGGLFALAGYLIQNFIPHKSNIGTFLFLISIVINGAPVIIAALKGLLDKQVNVDELLSLAIIACIIQREFLTAAVVSCIMVLGALIEEITAESARKSIQALIKVSPKNALILLKEGEKNVPVEEVNIGDILLIKPGEQVPVDAIVIEGNSVIDESAITGESIPMEKKIGDKLYAGTLNHSGLLKVEAKKVGMDTTLGKVIQLVSEAEKHKPESVSLANRFARWFTPTIITFAIIAWIVSGDFDRAVTVLIVGCPCALILAVPTAVVSSIGRAAKDGILIKGGQYLEKVAQVDTVFFDKTGTLSRGTPVVDSIVPNKGIDLKYLLLCAASIENNTSHPIARAVVKAAHEAGVSLVEAKDIVTETGLGVRGKIQDKMIETGSVELFGGIDNLPQSLQKHVQKAKNKGATPLIVYENQQALGCIIIYDQLRATACQLISRLKDLGCLNMGILSGDHEKSVRQIAKAVGINQIFSSLKPHEKLEIIKQTQLKGHRVMFVGDGINDAPALALADIGIAMAGQGTQVALETADIALMGDHIEKLSFLVSLSRKMIFIIKLNIVFGLVFNLIAVMAGAWGIITPIMGAVIHNIGSIIVVLSSASIGFIKKL